MTISAGSGGGGVYIAAGNGINNGGGVEMNMYSSKKDMKIYGGGNISDSSAIRFETPSSRSNSGSIKISVSSTAKSTGLLLATGFGAESGNIRLSTASSELGTAGDIRMLGGMNASIALGASNVRLSGGQGNGSIGLFSGNGRSGGTIRVVASSALKAITVSSSVSKTTGDVSFSTGLAYQSGHIVFGSAHGGEYSGTLETRSGDVGHGDSGVIRIHSGNTWKGKSGSIKVTSDDSKETGDVMLSTGDGTSAAGAVVLKPGLARISGSDLVLRGGNTLKGKSSLLFVSAGRSGG
jgi:hypothetical protein